MSKKYYSIPRGIVRETNKEIPQNFDLKKFFRRMLTHYNVPYLEICCDDGELSPTRYNTNSGKIEYFNISNSAWEDKPAETAIVSDTVSVDSINTELITSDNTVLILEANLSQNRESASYNATATVTASDLSGGLITSTSAAAVALTLPTATDLGTQINASRGTTLDFIVDNNTGANTVTVTVNTGITAIAGPVITGGATLTVASGTVGQFRIYFLTATTAKIARIF